MNGIVKRLQHTYGFLTTDDGRDLFFHESAIADRTVELAEGDRVSFEEVLPTPVKGPRARDVTLLFAGNHAQEATA